MSMKTIKANIGTTKPQKFNAVHKNYNNQDKKNYNNQDNQENIPHMQFTNALQKPQNNAGPHTPELQRLSCKDWHTYLNRISPQKSQNLSDLRPRQHYSAAPAVFEVMARRVCGKLVGRISFGIEPPTLF